MTASPASVASIFEAVQFIEAHLRRPVTVADMADSINYSLYHFCRTFNGVVRHSPYDYLMRRRLSESTRDLLDTDRAILDIAYDYQFKSHETYTRAFKRFLGVPPSSLRRLGRVEGRRLMPRLTLAHLQHINRGGGLRPVLVEQEARQVVGLMTLVGDSLTAVLELWQALARTVAHLDLEPRAFYGVAWYPDEWEARGFFYLAGMDVGSRDLSDTPLVTRVLAPGRYGRFIHQGPLKDRRLTQDAIYHTWLPQSGQCLAQPLEIECHGRCLPALDDPEARWELLIPLR